MNEVSRRLQEKMKQFAEIDKQIAKPNQNKSKELLNQKDNNKRNKQDNNQNKLIEWTTKDSYPSHYDKIYSNFNELSSRNKKSMKPDITTDQLTSTKHETKSKDAQQQLNQKETEYTFKTNRIIPMFNKDNTSMKKKGNKRLSTKGTKVGNRLYNYGYYLKNKIELKKSIEEQEMFAKMKPNIMQSTIDWGKLSTLRVKSSKRQYRTHHQRSLSKCNEDYTFKPLINPHSLSIANRLEPSYTRLMRKKKKYSNSRSQSKSNSSIELSYDWKNISYSDTPKGINKQPSKRIKSLYSEGVNWIKERNEVYERNKSEKENEYKYYSFKPKITSSPFTTGTNLIVKRPTSKSPNELYLEQSNWKKKIEKRNQSAREKKESELASRCTFYPNITPLTIDNDEKMILKNIGQMNDYVNKRRNMIQKQIEQEEYKQKRFSNNSNYQIKTTIPKEFAFKTRSRSKSNLRCYSKETSNVILNSSFSPNKVLYMRENYGTDDFFQINSSSHHIKNNNENETSPEVLFY